MSGGGGGGGPTTTTVNQSNIPEYLRPQVEMVLGGSLEELFQTQRNEDGTINIIGTKPFVPYSANVEDYVANFSPLQQQVQANAANLQMPGQFNQATGYANAAGQGGLDSAGRAYGYGNAGFQSGQMGQDLGIRGGQYYGNMGVQAGQQGQNLGIRGGQYYGNMGASYGAQAADVGQMGLRAEELGRNITGQARDYAAQQAAAGQQYARQMTNPYAVQQYMSPYQQGVTDVQLQGAQRQADIASTGRQANAARMGAFGGSRQAVENAEANRALASQMDAIRATGQQAAYDKAIQAMQYGSNLDLQGLSGAQQGLGTALQGGQLGLSGIGTALQGFQGGMQGAGIGLQGVDRQLAGTAQGMQGAQIGLSGVDRQLAGTAQGMQGAQVGLQGVSGAQAGYGLADRAAGTLGTLGNQQLNAQMGILGLQNQIGGQQQSYQQQLINQAIQNYAQAREAPMQAYNQYNALLRGYALPGTTQTQYQASPSLSSQVVGGGIAGLGLYNAMNPAKS